MLLLIFHLICDHLPNLFSGIIQNVETLLDRILLYKGRVLKKNTCDQKNQNCRHFNIKIFFLMQSFFHDYPISHAFTVYCYIMCKFST